MAISLKIIVLFGAAVGETSLLEQGHTIRLFIGTTLEPDVHAAAARLVRDLKARYPELRWVIPENLHLTLKFLGSVESGRLTEISAALSETAMAIQPFPVRFGGLGAIAMQ